jgi:hypothetical protein
MQSPPNLSQLLTLHLPAALVDLVADYASISPRRARLNVDLRSHQPADDTRVLQHCLEVQIHRLRMRRALNWLLWSVARTPAFYDDM